MNPLRILPLALGAALVFGAAAHAAETPERELRMLGRCALAASVYKSLLPPATPPVSANPTEADIALYKRLHDLEPTLKGRADALAETVDPAVRDGLGKELTDQFQTQMAPKGAPRKTPREALDLYAPIIEACIVRAGILASQ